MVISRNVIIDECIKKIESLLQPYCDDHTPYRGACGNCGRYTNSHVLPDIYSIKYELDHLKTKEAEKSYSESDMEQAFEAGKKLAEYEWHLSESHGINCKCIPPDYLHFQEWVEQKIKG